MSTNSSGFLLIFRDPADDCYSRLSVDEKKALADKWNEWYDGLAANGKVQHGHPLQPTGRVVTGTRGERVVDGPFSEAKEAIGGYFLLTVSDLDEATEIARHCPSLSLGMSVEVRALADACEALGVKGRPLETANPLTV